MAYCNENWKAKLAAVSLQESLNRVLAEDAITKEDFLTFDKSTVDGYALKSVGTLMLHSINPQLCD
ncbi:MAG: hypothetical protein ABSA75_00275 [Candidatus Bathyarchaeia archaeon]|jgi:molybdopterin biosynthesis enzyme